MKTNLTIVLLLPILLGLAGCIKQNPAEEIDSSDGLSYSERSVKEGVVDILFSEKMASEIEYSLTKSSSIHPSLKSAGIDSLKRIFPDGEPYEKRRKAFGLNRWYRVYFSGDIPATKAFDSFCALEGVEHIEPERPVKSLGESPNIFDDPDFTQGKQWHYYNDGGLSANHTPGADINVLPVWQNYTRGSRAVTVAVIDGGIDTMHEDLAANCTGGKNFVTGGRLSAEDHGTHVAGTIAAVNNNGTGVCGIAGGNFKDGECGVGLLSCQIFVGSKSGDGAEALVWAADNGAVIANNSWGYEFTSKQEAQEATISRTLKEAIDYFIKYAGCDDDGNQRADSPMKGGLVLFSAGNDGWNVDPIGQYEPVMSVGAMTADFSRATYSNYGDWVDIAAPGGSESARNNTLVLSTLPGNRYGYMQGTSMACPHVSGVAALVVSYFGKPGFTADMLKKKLLDGARYDVLPPGANIGPLVDACGAFTCGSLIAPDKVSDYALNITGNRITAKFAVTSDSDDVKAYGYNLYVSKDKSLLEALTPAGIPDGVSSVSALVGAKKAGEDFEISLGQLEFETDYYVGITAYDYSQNCSEMSEIKKVRTGQNLPPEIVCEEGTSSLTVKAHEEATVLFHIADPEGETLTVQCSPKLSGCSLSRISDEIWALKINGRTSSEGNHSVNITAADTYGLETSCVFNYTVHPNHAPVQTAEFENIYLSGKGKSFSLDLNSHFSDEDGESLKFSSSVTGNHSVADVSVTNGGTLEISVRNYGLIHVTVTASDANNATVSAEFSIMAKNPENLVETYPVPAKDYLTVRTGSPAETLIELFSSSGIKLSSEKTEVSAFSPYKLDLRGCAPGRYRLKVTIGGNVYDKIIVKI